MTYPNANTLRAQKSMVERNIKKWTAANNGDMSQVHFIVRMNALVERSPGKLMAYNDWLREQEQNNG